MFHRDEDSGDLIRLWQYANLHIVHVIRNVDPEKLNAVQFSSRQRRRSRIISFTSSSLYLLLIILPRMAQKHTFL